MFDLVDTGMVLQYFVDAPVFFFVFAFISNRKFCGDCVDKIPQ